MLRGSPPGTQSPPTTYTANALNQYTATQNPAESFTHDLDGNLTQDGSCAYVWDAENRLVEATPLSPTTGAQKVVNRYDYLGRRVQKQVWTWNGVNWGASPTAERRFIYDGRLLLLELDGIDDNVPLRKYTWGLDLSGLGGSLNDRRTAGGIGGLLATEDTDPGTQQTDGFFYFYDANGNVGQLLATATGSVAVQYEYDPYGNRTNAPTQGEFDQPFRFSTKYFDAETGLYDFGYRFYSPRTGRWTSRDPIDESDDTNLYRYVRNNTLARIDASGLEGTTVEKALTQALARGDVAQVQTILESAGELLTPAARQAIQAWLKKNAQCVAIHAAYKALNCKKCTSCTPQAEAAANAACFSAEVSGRTAYLALKCDYVLAGSIARGSKKAELGHATELAQKSAALAKCVERSTAKK